MYACVRCLSQWKNIEGLPSMFSNWLRWDNQPTSWRNWMESYSPLMKMCWPTKWKWIWMCLVCSRKCQGLLIYILLSFTNSSIFWCLWLLTWYQSQGTCVRILGWHFCLREEGCHDPLIDIVSFTHTMWIALLLSQYRGVGWWRWMPMSPSI